MVLKDVIVTYFKALFQNFPDKLREPTRNLSMAGDVIRNRTLRLQNMKRVLQALTAAFSKAK
jgi:hypothetical protein